MKFSRVMPAGGRLVTRASAFAPCAINRRASSRLVIVPEPCGGGLLLPATPVLRTQVSWWSAVHPCGAALASAPRSSRKAASSKCPLPTATSNAVSPVSGAGAGSLPSAVRLAGGSSDSLRTGARVEQRPHRVQPAFPDRKQQRREPAVRPGVDVRAVGDQRLHDRRVSVCRGPHERGLTAPCFLRIDGGSARDQQVHALDAAGPRRSHQRRFPFRAGRIRIGAAAEQQIDDRRIAGLARQRQRLHAVAIGGADVCARANQQFDHRRIGSARRPVQGGRAVNVGGVRVRVLREHRRHGRAIEMFHRIDERRLVGAGHGGRRPHREQQSKRNEHHAGHGRPPRHNDTGSTTSPARPVLSTNESRRTPMSSSSVRCRFASGVPSW